MQTFLFVCKIKNYFIDTPANAGSFLQLSLHDNVGEDQTR